MNATPLQATTPSSVPTFLPLRPLAVDGRYVLKQQLQAVLLGLVTFALGGFMIGYAFMTAGDILAARSLFHRGTPAEILDVGGKVTENSKLGVTFLYEYKLELPFTDADGGDHLAKVEFDRFWSAVPDDAVPALRYDAANPEHVALNWAFDGGFNTWGWPAFMLLTGAMVLAGSLAIFFGGLRNARALRHGAAAGVEVLLECLSVQQVQRSHHITFLAPDPRRGGVRRRKAVSAKPPLIVRVGGVPHLLALVANDGRKVHVHLVDRELSGLMLPAPLKAEILRRAEEAA